MAANTPTTDAIGPQSPMDENLLKAATCGEYWPIEVLVGKNLSILLGTTPQGNNCLHISTIHGHQEFGSYPLQVYPSLLQNVNCENETPLIIAVSLGHASLASSFLQKCCGTPRLSQAILQQDRYGFNALHHAIRNGHKHLALELIAKVPALSKAVTKYNESPMFIAVMRNFVDVSEKLLDVVDSSHVGQYGRHALHAAARNGNKDIAHQIMVKRPCLATEADRDGITPLRMAISYNKVDVLQVLLKNRSSLAYETDKHGDPLLCAAASRGQVDVARALLKFCPDAFYCRLVTEKNPVIGESSVSGGTLTCLHIAVSEGHLEFVNFILQTRQLRKLINMQDKNGRTSLHYAVEQCDPRLVAALLSHESIDPTILDNRGNSAASQLSSITIDDKTLDWKEVNVLMSKADPNDNDSSLYNLRKGAKKQESIASRRQRESMTQKYRNNTSLVAILLATITFTAAFTLPGGYSSDSGNAGLPTMSGKVTFIVFLIFDTLAMCSSFVVAFICLMGKWEDDKFTTCYISVTKKLTWFAYFATVMAFSTGLYPVLAPRLFWLATLIWSLVGFFFILTIFIAKWPSMKLSFRLGHTWHDLELKFLQWFDLNFQFQ